MHPFQHPIGTPMLCGSREDWIEHMRSLYLPIVAGNRVLEIASNGGSISQAICLLQPKSLTMIDADPASVKINGADLINEDVTFWLPKAPKFDVVVCFGLFYHIHHSLHLLEMIVNYCEPQHLILDNVVAPHPLAFIFEESNQPGNRWVNNGWKHAPFNLNVPFHIFNQSLNHMGYDLTQTHKLAYNFFQKHNHWIGQWRYR